MTCGRCKNSAPEGVRFCPTCGADLVVQSPAIDPLAATALANPKELQAIRDAASRDRKSGERLSASSVDPVSSGRGGSTAVMPARLPTGIGSPNAGASRPAPSNVALQPSAVPTNAPVPLPLARGARALVRWSNGQQYPGIVEEISQDGRALIAFPDGQRHWVGLAYVTPSFR